MTVLDTPLSTEDIADVQDTTDAQPVIEAPPPPMTAAQRLAAAEQRRRAEAEQARIAALAKYHDLVNNGGIDLASDDELAELSQQLGITGDDIAADVAALKQTWQIEQQLPDLKERIELAKVESTRTHAEMMEAPAKAQRIINDANNAAGTAVNRLNRLRDEVRTAERPRRIYSPSTRAYSVDLLRTRGVRHAGQHPGVLRS